jgi:hypothetical protein
VILKGDIGDLVPIVYALRLERHRIALGGVHPIWAKPFLTIIGNALNQHAPELEVLNISGLSMQRIIELVDNSVSRHRAGRKWNWQSGY